MLTLRPTRRTGSDPVRRSCSPCAPRSAAADPGHETGQNDTEVLDDEPRNILISLISQLRVGMDLHRVTLPTSVARRWPLRTKRLTTS